MRSHQQSCLFPRTNILYLVGDLYDHPITEETPKSLSRLLSVLDRQLPGILHQLSKFDRITSQNIVDLLGAGGEIMVIPTVDMLYAFPTQQAIWENAFSDILGVSMLNA